MKSRMELRGVYIHISVRDKLGISNNDYILLDSVFKLQANVKYPGWCFAGRDHLARCVGVKIRSLHRIINKLIDKNLLEVNQTTKHLRTTSLFIENSNFEEVPESKSIDITDTYDAKEDVPELSLHKASSGHDKKSLAG